MITPSEFVTLAASVVEIAQFNAGKQAHVEAHALCAEYQCRCSRLRTASAPRVR
ncbi:MAG: hypothetical protein JO352_25925 [Chloroflexi bacterium]|nr:hypothetical protein [Chloroflexota bacterium]MBV9598402.1 hypothetical protein [Chloroflexota bacterium]